MNNESDPGTYIRFVEGPPKPRTKTWWVVTRDDDIHLGWVGWFGRWRKYAFYPKPDTVYEQVCLRDIALFCETQTSTHKRQRVAERRGEEFEGV